MNEKQRKKFEELIEDEEVIDIPQSCGSCAFCINDTCRKYAPRPIALPDTGNVKGYIATFPYVDQDQWCGEYQLDQYVYKEAPRYVKNGIKHVGGELPEELK